MLCKEREKEILLAVKESWLKTRLTVVHSSSAFEVMSLLMLPVGPELQELILIAPRERGEWLSSNRFYVKGDYSNLNTKYWQLRSVGDCWKFFSSHPSFDSVSQAALSLWKNA